VIRLRKKRRKGAAWIAQVGLAASTVQAILNQTEVTEQQLESRCVGIRATGRARRHQETGSHDGGGWRMHGRGNDGYGFPAMCICTPPSMTARIVYSESTGMNSCHCCWVLDPSRRLLRPSVSTGRDPVTDVCGTTPAPPPHHRYRPQTNGKIERSVDA
jgi:hypothetical protein